MHSMLSWAKVFNQGLENWNISKSVTSMTNLFAHASAFNQPINDWNVGSVQKMQGLFLGASAFNHGHDQHLTGRIGLQPTHWQLECVERAEDAGHVPVRVWVRSAPFGLGRGPRHERNKHVCTGDCLLRPAPRPVVRVKHSENAGHVQRGEQL